MTEGVFTEKLRKALADKCTQKCAELAYLIAQTSRDERHLLDGIKLANEAVRSLATTMFVEQKKDQKNEE